MKNHFFIPYAGNKREEVETIHEFIKDRIENKNLIIEPFCGSCAISFYISTLYPGKYTYVLNDNNGLIVELLNIVKDDEKFENLCLTLNEVINSINTKEEYKKVVNESTLAAFIIGNSYYAIRPKMYPIDARKKRDYNYLKSVPIVNFLKNEKIITTSRDALDVVNEYKDNSKACFFVDPPYLLACNQFYASPGVAIYEYTTNHNMNNLKAQFVFILEDNWIIKSILQKYNKISYDKTYQMSSGQTNKCKKKTVHAIYINEPTQE